MKNVAVSVREVTSGNARSAHLAIRLRCSPMSGRRDDLRHAPVSELAAQLRSPADRTDVFSAHVVDELVRRAELSERLEAQIRYDSLRAMSPPTGYTADDF